MVMMYSAHLLAQCFMGVGLHTAFPPTPPAPLPHRSSSSLEGLRIGAKYSVTELGMGGISLVARGSDSGMGVPHIPNTNTLLPAIIAFGSSKVMFGSSKVQINAQGGAKHTGCCILPYVPMSFNLACNDPVKFPGDMVIAPNTVFVGMTLGDIVAGFVDMAVDIGLSYVTGKALGALNKGVGKFMFRHFTEAGTAAWTKVFCEFAADGVDGKWSAMAATHETDEVVDHWLEKTVVGKLLDKTVEKVEDTANEKWVISEHGKEQVNEGMVDALTGEPGEGNKEEGDPPIYGTDKVDPDYVHVVHNRWLS